MLVLTRKLGQKIIINENIEVIILESKGESVKIGIKAPKSVTIYREEIFEEIKKANAQSTKSVEINDLKSVMGLFESQKTMNINYMDKISKLSNKTD